MNGICIRPICENDLFDVAEIEEICFSSPWSCESLKMLCREGGMGYVAYDTEAEKVLAYGGMLCVLDEGQITNIATHPSARRRGLGEAVVRALLCGGEAAGLSFFSLEVRESNVAAISLYEKLGFVRAGVRKGFYSNPSENGIVMIKEK